MLQLGHRSCGRGGPHRTARRAWMQTPYSSPYFALLQQTLRLWTAACAATAFLSATKSRQHELRGRKRALQPSRDGRRQTLLPPLLQAPLKRKQRRRLSCTLAWFQAWPLHLLVLVAALLVVRVMAFLLAALLLALLLRPSPMQPLLLMVQAALKLRARAHLQPRLQRLPQAHRREQRLAVHQVELQRCRRCPVQLPALELLLLRRF